MLRDRRAYAVLLALAAAVVVALRALGGDGGERPPADRAARLVPADALVYLHVSTERERAPVERMLALLRRLGAEDALAEAVGGLLTGGAGGASVATLEADVRPWLGDEAALALTPGARATAGSLLLLAVADEAAARRFVARTAGPGRRERHRGVALLRHDGGVATALVDGFLAIGQPRTVRGAIARAAGRGRSLAGAAAYRAARTAQPADRVADAYASAAGVRRLLAPRRDLLGLVGAMLDQRGLHGTGLALTAGEDAATVRMRAVLDRREREPARPFTPSLTRAVPADALAFAAFPGLREAGPALLGLGGAGGLGGDAAELVAQAARLLAEHGVDFGADVVPLFGEEVALALIPDGAGSAAVLLGRAVDEARTRAALARIEPAIAALFAPAGGDAPAFADARAGGAPARRLLADGAEVAYAVRDGVLAVSTSLRVLGRALDPARTIAENPQFRAVIPDSQSELTSIVFLDFSQLLSLFEPLGLTGGPGVAGFLQGVRAVGLTSMSGEAHTTAELTFEIR